MPRIPLLAKIIIAIAAGIGAGMIFPDWLARCFATFNALFSALLAFVIPLLIVGFVAPAISDIGRRAGEMLLATVAVAYGMTFCSGLLAYFTADLTFPSLIDADSYMLRSGTAEAAGPAPYFTIAVDLLMSVTSALVLAFLLGFGGGCHRIGYGIASRVGRLPRCHPACDNPSDNPAVASLYLRHIHDYDSQRSSRANAYNFCRNHRSDIRSPCRCTCDSVLHSIAVQPSQSFSMSLDYDARLLHGIGHSIVSRDYSGHAQPGNSHGCRPRCSRIRSTALCHYPHVGFDS